MNERIRELAEKASDDIGMVGYHNIPDQYKEKFAELIVRDCCDIAYEHDAPKMSGPGMIIAGRIKQHFGV